MNPQPKKPKHDDFSPAVGRSLHRAAKQARKIARIYATPVYVMGHGKIVAEKP
jgi:hypothetical protein